MSAIKVFKEAVEVLKALSAAAASARSEVQQLLVVLEGPAVADVKPKFAEGLGENESFGETIRTNGNGKTVDDYKY